MEQTTTMTLFPMDLQMHVDHVQDGGAFDRSLFTAISNVSDGLQRQTLLKTLRDICRNQRRLTQFETALSQWISQQNQHHQLDSNLTAFTDSPLVLRCGSWLADDSGVYQNLLQKDGTIRRQMACPHPIVPVARLINKKTGEEKLQLAFFRDGAWKTATAACTMCYDARQIIQLARQGILVNSETARHLVAYLYDIASLNQQNTAESQALPQIATTSQLGWCDGHFFPYSNALQCDTGQEFLNLYRQFHYHGSWSTWFDLAEELRQSPEHIIIRMLMAASLSSPLLELLGAQPYIFHLWGRSGFGKTTALMLAMSIWGNPDTGALTRTMNMTGNAMARTAAFLQHLPFAADDLQQLRAGQEDLNALIMSMSEGMDRGRAKAEGGIDELYTWRNVLLFTGEQPLIDQRSGSGARNRVLEIEVSDKLFANGFQAANSLRRNYGWAGPEFIAYVQLQSPQALQQRFAALQQQLLSLCDTSEKQTSSMAALLLADELACQCIFNGQTPLTAEEVAPYLRLNEEIDAAQQAYQFICDLIASNSNRFHKEQPGEIWGKISNDSTYAMMNKSILTNQLERNGYNTTATLHRWAELGLLEKTPQGKLTHSRAIYGIKASFIKLYMPDCALEEAS